jgi:hypothetical protein
MRLIVQRVIALPGRVKATDGQLRTVDMKRYRIVVRGEFGDLLTSAFSEFHIEAANGQTSLTGYLVDCAALYGVLDRLRDFAIEVVSFRELNHA